VRRHAELYAEVRRNRLAAGTNDLWIAACALHPEVPLIARNTRDFGLPAGLTILDYGGAPGG